MGGPENIASLLANDYLPEHTPIIFLGTSNRVLDFIHQTDEKRLKDYLELPVTNQLFQMAKTDDSELSVLILQIIFLYSINKTTGLEFGDFILNEMAARLTETIGSTATCYRFSSGDFVVLLPGIDLQKSCSVAEKIRKFCSEKPYTDGKHTISITISAGVASLKNHKPGNHGEVICMAETVLYIAKAEGRNRLQIYNPLNDSKEFSPKESLRFLKENLSRSLDKTRVSAFASLQLLAKNIEELKKEAEKILDPYLILHILAVIKKKSLFNLDTDFLDQAQLDLLKTFPK